MRVLIAEDDQISRKILETNLRKWNYEVIIAEDGQQAWDTLNQPDAPRLAVLDWMMPGMDGIDVCRRLFEDRERPFTFVVMLTAKDQKEDIATALDAGASDYLTKPWAAVELRARVDAGRRFVELQRALEKANEKLALMARTDALTGIRNRPAVLETLGHELARSEREERPIAVLIGDVDHFKQVNDRYGHATGDQALIEVARRMQETCRLYDVVGRYGGEEFLAILPGVSEHNLKALAERFRRSVSSAPVPVEENALDITMSVGAVWRMPGQPADADTMVREADSLLYRAKEEGRNRSVIGPLPDPE